jgi:hypothetical protein
VTEFSRYLVGRAWLLLVAHLHCLNPLFHGERTVQLLVLLRYCPLGGWPCRWGLPAGP